MEGRRLRLTSFLQVIWSLLRDTYSEWSKANATVLGAALAFYTIFSLAPIFIIVVAVVGFVVGQESVQTYLVSQAAHFIGANNAANIMHIVQNSYKMGSGIKATIVALILVLVGSTTAFVMLKNALDRLWGIKTTSSGLINILKSRLSSFVVVLFLGLIVFLSIILNSLISAVRLFLTGYVNIPFGLIALGNEVLMVFLLTILFAMLFKILPDAKISWGDVWIGGAITALLFFLGRYLLGLYLGRSTISSAYGAAGSLVVILMWVYYSSQILFFGAAFTQVYARRYGTAIIPKEPQP